MLDYLNRLTGQPPADVAAVLAALGVLFAATWATARAGFALWRAGAALCRLLAPRPSELCKALLAALEAEAAYDPKEGGGTLMTPACVVCFGRKAEEDQPSTAVRPSIQTDRGDSCDGHLTARDRRRVFARARARRDAVLAAEAAQARAHCLAELRRTGRAAPPQSVGSCIIRTAAAESWPVGDGKARDGG